MSDQFVAEIRIVGFNFPPRGWATCAGQLLPISQNTALFSLVGTYYGGDGRSTFGLPNLQGRVPIGNGQGPGLSDRVLGEEGGVETVTLLASEIPAHTHAIGVVSAKANKQSPVGNYFATDATGKTKEYSSNAPNAAMAASVLQPVGSSQPHSNLQPTLVVNYVIALQGIFPPRS